MTSSFRITENWLTKKPSEAAFYVASLLTSLLLLSGFLYLSGRLHASEWMPASPHDVFVGAQIWRLWSALFAHADMGHLMNNALMFFPLTYLLVGYFGFYLFPILGMLMGGIINFLVLKSMPPESSLIGISGVVYWMGAVWLTLFVLIDSRKSLRRRLSIALFLSIVLFAPETYKPQISYLSHLLGYILGIASGALYYLIHRKKFLAAEVREEIFEESDSLKLEQDDVQPQERANLKVPL